MKDAALNNSLDSFLMPPPSEYNFLEKTTVYKGEQEPASLFDIQWNLTQAIEYHQTDQLFKAQEIYKQILFIDPNHPDALHLSGIIAHQIGKNEIAISLITRAIHANSDNHIFHKNLGSIFQALKNYKKAAACFKKALQIKPDDAGACYNMGNVLSEQKKYTKAISWYEKSLQLKPNFAEAHYNMGNTFKYHGEPKRAIFCYQTAVKINPNYAEALNNMGNVLRSLNEYKKAIQCYEKALKKKPDYAEAYYNLGHILHDSGKIEQAVPCYQKAIELMPDYAEAYNNIGYIFKDQGLLSEAILCFQRSIQIDPNFESSFNNMGNALSGQGKLDEAMLCYRNSLTIKPDFAPAHSNLIYCMNFQEDINPIRLFEEHKNWAQQHAHALKSKKHNHHNSKSLGKKLRIGYVSSDFRAHSVSYFMEPLLESHDNRSFKVFCYSDVPCYDSVTDRLSLLADKFRKTSGLPDEDMAKLIKKDRIDILFDLAGHTAGNRLLVFARKPAPIQVTYLGYPNTTGLEEIDYRITDAIADPLDRTDNLHTEKLVQLSSGFLCFKPEIKSPPVSNQPSERSGIITFGSFNQRAKISPKVIKLWSTILTIVPNSQIILKSKELIDTETRKRLIGSFAENGLPPEKIKLLNYISSTYEHLELYNTVDIGLDTFPYNGTTTTCEAMWMGVPVIVLAGKTHLSRVGVSLLSRVGLDELIAESHDEYIAKAVKLANDPGRLRKYRNSLRNMMLQSVLTNAKEFTQEFEAALKKMWIDWCEGG